MEVQSTEEETAELLSRVLNGNMLASEALAKVVHEDVDFTDPTLEALDISIPQEILGIWVDPIGKGRLHHVRFLVCSSPERSSWGSGQL